MERMDEIQLQEQAPAVFGRKPSPKASHRYNFISTKKIIKAFEKEGWYPVRVQQTKARDAQNQVYRKHTIRFRNDAFMDAEVGDIIPELHYSNAHDTTCALRLNLAAERVKCKNGLIMTFQDMISIRMRHSGFSQAELRKALREVLAQFKVAFQRIAEYTRIQLSPTEQIELARAAMHIRWGEETNVKIAPEALLECRRDADNKNDLWTVFNRVQENIIRGGGEYKNDEGKTRHVRKIRGAVADERINKELWLVLEAARVSRMSRQ